MAYKDPEKQKEAQRKYNAKRQGTRSRGWACIIYPESAQKDWQEKIEFSAY